MTNIIIDDDQYDHWWSADHLVKTSAKAPFLKEVNLCSEALLSRTFPHLQEDHDHDHDGRETIHRQQVFFSVTNTHTHIH